MRKKSGDPSIDDEPFASPGISSDGSVLDEPALGAGETSQEPEERALHNVWDEPTNLVRKPGGAIDYATWYRAGVESTSPLKSWSVICLLALVGGPVALLAAAFPSGSQATVPWIMIVFVAPVLEEVLKVTAIAVAFERRPYLFVTPAQLMGAVWVSAAVFATIENVMYINVYTDAPTAALERWRWTTCTALHVGATTIAGLGLRQMWKRSRQDYSKPQMKYAYPYLAAAAVVHGTYNLFASAYTAIWQPF